MEIETQLEQYQYHIIFILKNSIRVYRSTDGFEPVFSPLGCAQCVCAITQMHIKNHCPQKTSVFTCTGIYRNTQR